MRQPRAPAHLDWPVEFREAGREGDHSNPMQVLKRIGNFHPSRTDLPSPVVLDNHIVVVLQPAVFERACEEIRVLKGVLPILLLGWIPLEIHRWLLRADAGHPKEGVVLVCGRRLGDLGWGEAWDGAPAQRANILGKGAPSLVIES